MLIRDFLLSSRDHSQVSQVQRPAAARTGRPVNLPCTPKEHTHYKSSYRRLQVAAESNMLSPLRHQPRRQLASVEVPLRHGSTDMDFRA